MHIESGGEYLLRMCVREKDGPKNKGREATRDGYTPKNDDERLRWYKRERKKCC
jgi:hypothetical protein